MKNSVLIVFASVAIIVPSFFIIKYGVNPRPKPIIKPSNFETFESIGSVLFSQLARDIETHPIIAIGISDPDDLKIVDGFIVQSIKSKKSFDEVVILINQKVLFDVPTEHMPYENRERVISYLNEKISYGQKIIVIAQNWDTPHFQTDSFVGNLEIKDKILSITATRGSTNLDNLKRDCGGVGYSTDNIKISCIAYMQSTKIPKKANREKNMVSAERYGLRDYVYTVIEVQN